MLFTSEIRKVIVLNFWFTACTPCKAEIQELNRLKQEYGDVEFIAVALDKSERLKDFLKDFPFEYRIVPDTGSAVTKKFGIKAFPSHLIIDQDGKIYYRRTGGGENVFQDLSGVIDRLLENKE